MQRHFTCPYVNGPFREHQPLNESAKLIANKDCSNRRCKDVIDRQSVTTFVIAL